MPADARRGVCGLLSTGEGEMAEKGCSCCGHDEARYKKTPRSEKLEKDIVRRLNRAMGQLNGVKSMVEEGRYCGDILVQLAAAQSAVKSVSAIILENHLQTCVVEEIQAGNTEVVEEFVKLVKKFS